MIKKHTIGDFLKRVKNTIDIDDSESYKRVTIKTNHQGVVLRNEALGAEIGTKKQFIINGGDFILSKIDARYGAFGIIPKHLDGAIITGNFWAYEVNEDLVDTEWFFYFTHSFDFIQICKESSTGTTHRKYLNEKTFLNHQIYLPGKAEQIKMVQYYKKSADFGQVTLNEIKTQKKLLSQLKQSILQEAIQGKLTADWRKENPELITGENSAEKLLEKIKAEKAQLIKEKKIKNENALPPITEDEIHYELPKGWVWCRWGEISTYSEAGKSLTCLDRKVEGTEWGILKVSATSTSEFKQEENKFLVADLKEIPSYKVRKGDLILSRANTKELVGNSVIVDEANYNLLLSDKTVRFHFTSFTDKKYLNLTNKSTYFRKFLIRNCTGSSPTMKNVSRLTIKLGILPLPPFEEQKAIVNRVDSLLQECNSLEKEIEHSEKYAEKLMQAVLKEAFVPKVKEEIVEA